MPYLYSVRRRNAAMAVVAPEPASIAEVVSADPPVVAVEVTSDAGQSAAVGGPESTPKPKTRKPRAKKSDG